MLGIFTRRDLVALANNARDAKRWKEAEQLYRKALDQDPKNSPIWVQYGHALKEGGSLAAAEAAYRHALLYNPREADSYLQLGHVLKLEGKPGEMQAAYLRAFARDPSLPDLERELSSLGWSGADLAELRTQLTGDEVLETTADPAPEPETEFAPVPQNIAHDAVLEFHVDAPNIVGGMAAQKITGNLQISGWAFAPEGVAALVVHIDGKQKEGLVKYGLRREDVQAAHPDWENALTSGYLLQVPTRGLMSGIHLVRVELRTHGGRTKPIEFQIEADIDPEWKLPRKMAQAEVDYFDNILSAVNWRPSISILMQLCDFADVAPLDVTLRSLHDQTYKQWQLTLLCDDAADRALLAEHIGDEFPDLANRITLTSANTINSFQDFGERSDLIGTLVPGDQLGCDALLRIATATGIDREADFFYGDEYRANPISGGFEVFLKPQWSPDLLQSTNYIGRFWCARSTLFEYIDITPIDWCRLGDYDLVLRCTDKAKIVRHIPHILCESRKTSRDKNRLERAALVRALARQDIKAEITQGCAEGYYRVRRRPVSRGLVSIIIPTGGKVALLEICLRGIFERTRNQNFELILLYNDSTRPEAFPYFQTLKSNPRIRIIDSEGPFNFSRICNLGAAAARGEFLLFLNDDIEVIEPNWIDELMGHAERPEIGVVGARLLYPDGTVQHAGLFWGGRAEGGRHAFRYASRSDPGYFGLAMTTRNVLAVTGACIMLRKSWFEKIGGFDESHSIVNNDVDLCLRSWSHGGRVVYEPAVCLFHHEMATRHDLPDTYDVAGFDERWASLLQRGDPYYHLNLAHDRDDYLPDIETAKTLYVGYPLFRRDDIKRILILKLDHIGDFVTAVPAILRLKEKFPGAKFYILALPGNVGLIKQFVPEIEEIIPFGFFHARSGSGQHSVTDEDLELLRKRLAPYRFDLAIDLRKHLETRHLLRLTGARWLAGYDRDGAFPWLDIAPEWDGDSKLAVKRTHVSEDLIRLVDAVVAASDPLRTFLQAPPVPDSFLPKGIGQTGKPLVCIHPAVGTETRQWPPQHYATLIDLLIELHDVEIALIGGPDEMQVAEEVLANVRDTRSVQSLVGMTKLSDLPALLARAALFVGNNSGPKHIAAGLGIPTIGIHSGVVDAREWGPKGPNAVVMRRAMTCSPCYLSEIERCPRGFSCMRDLFPAAVYDLCRQMLPVRSLPSSKMAESENARD